MKNLKNYILSAAVLVAFMSCSSDDDNPVANNVTLEFNNTFGATPIVLGDATSASATVNTSDEGQTHHFEEVKYVISNIRLIKADGTEIPYNVNDLDNGATVINHALPETLNYVMSDIPVGDYSEIRFGLGVKSELNTLDEASFPNFYASAGENDTEMHWEWGTGYRFTKIEGFYGSNNDVLSIHSGSTVEGEEGSYTQGVDAYRDITLTLPTNATVGNSAPTIVINADFDYLLSGQSHTITLGESNATPSIHTAVEMTKFVENIGGNGTTDTTGMFSIQSVEN
ncbi:MbnP family protein [Winogradskyella vidalii]|uniref:MbnP family protein n=1 Tax=Winogradskyella vidalii TaxID=2615024 RepID=UPI0015CD8FE0|nr:MbnP family protein [Winogradskyella vidalii]